MTENSFGPEFYRRFYMDPRTRVTTRAEMVRRARTLAVLVQHLELPVRRILDAGCGLGWMRAPLLRAFPGATYTGLEVSEHLCSRHGWVCTSLERYRPRSSFDLVICYDVMQYLHERAAVQALANLARLSRGAVYFHAPTLEDWRHNADRASSDGDIELRATAWYRKRLAPRFRHAGFGIYLRRGVSVPQWELEKP